MDSPGWSVLALMGLVGCTSILGGDFEIVPAGAGGEGSGASGGAAGGGGGVGGGETCTPDTSTCVDEDTRELCDADGNATTEDCATDTPACLDGECVTCIDDDVQCDGDTAQICAANTWDDVEICPNGCDAGACLEVVDISAGSGNTCVVMSNGTARCWGYNAKALLNLDNVDDPASPGTFITTPAEVPNLTDAVEIGSGNAHNCVITASNTVRCWGWNAFGQLGTGNVADADEPVEPAITGGVTSMAVAVAHMCVGLDTGKVNCWGLNESGQLGNGEIDTPAFHSTPQEVLNLPFSPLRVTADYGNSCAVLATNDAACWGDNGGGQLNNGNTSDSGTPVFIGGDGVEEIDVGSRHMCWRVGTTIRCFGSNNNGQIGDGTTTAPTAAFQPSVSNPARIFLSGNVTCAIDTSDKLFCWGRNVEGQQGNGASGAGVYVTTPTEVPVGTVADVALGYSHSCVLTTDGRVLCWGSNNHGQVGTGSTSVVVADPVEVDL